MRSWTCMPVRTLQAFTVELPTERSRRTARSLLARCSVEAMLDPAGGRPILTVMYKKAPGYDASNGDFWYGRLASDGTPARADFVGKVSFCVECHAGAKATDRAWGVPAAGR